MEKKISERIISTDDGLLDFLISDNLEEYRVKTMLTKEPETIKWINSFPSFIKKAPVTFWDIGSNIGIYTLYAATKYPKLQVMSFEPYFKNFNRLKANISLNNLNNITPMNLAMGEHSALITFCGQDDRFGASGNIVMPSNNLKDNTKYKVKENLLQVSGDDLLTLHLQIPNFIKIDVDGLELDIIKGMKEILKRDALKSVLIEINNKEELIIVKDIFSKHGFSLDDNFNLLLNHSRKRRSQDPLNTAENWIFTRT